METIILTDNKRHSTDYSADKTLFAQKIDVNHILNTEVYQSHISKVRFWIVKSNIPNQQNLIMEVCKNLVNRGSNSINFQFGISRICIGDEAPLIEQKRTNSSNQKFMRSSRVSGYLTPSSMIKTLQFPSFMNSSFKKQSNHMKTISNMQWNHHQNQSTDQQKRAQQSSQTPKQQEIRLKSICKKQFQISSLTELSAIFMSKQSVYSQFNINQQLLTKSKRIVMNYIFRQNQIQIGISIISQGSRKYLQKAINIQISQAFNIQFNSRKQAYQSNCITENFSTTTIPKSSTKIGIDIHKQTYHKILLFLFTHFDSDSEKGKVSSSGISSGNINKDNKFVQSIQEWKMKDEDINITEKLSKEYVLIKQQVQNQKANFKNRLKIFQAIIGQSVNVEKLLNEEKQAQTNSNNNSSTSNQLQNPVSGAINDIRISRKSQLKSMLNNPQTATSSSNNSQFKRLKQSFQMIRNIDNVINQQTKKIQTLKKYLKQVVKQKDQILYKHARSLNQIKKQIKTIKEEIQQKKLQFKFKTEKSHVQQIQNQRNFAPTKQAQQVLNQNVKLFKRIIDNQRPTKNNQNILNQDLISPSSIGNKQNILKAYKAFQKSNNLLDAKKQFMIRKQHKSFYTNQGQNNNSSLVSQSPSIYSPTPCIMKTMHQQNRAKQSRLLKKRQQQVQNHNLWMNVHKQNNRKTQCLNDGNQMSNQQQKQLLMKLYEYYQRNCSLLRQVDMEIWKFKGINNNSNNNVKINMTIGSNNRSQLLNVKQNNFSSELINSRKNQVNKLLHFESQIKNINNSNNSTFISSLQLDFNNFPYLNTVMHPRISQSAFQSEECSVISDEIQQKDIKNIQKLNLLGQNQQGNKRITLQNMFIKK